MKAHNTKNWLNRLGHSLRWRLLALFLLLALAMTATFIVGTTKAFSGGWRAAFKPLLSDYMDRLAADIGSPPDAGKARALAERLPISLRIEGPATQFDSHPERQFGKWSHDGEGSGDASGDTNRRFFKRQTPDGHTITFGLGNADWRRGPGKLVWLTLTMLLLLMGAAFAYVRRLFKPLDDIGAGVQRFGAGNFSQPIAVARCDELGDLAGQINTMGQEIAQMLDAKRALLLAISHELRSPLTRARLNSELLPESADTQDTRRALLRDLAEMAQLITDRLESEQLSGIHAALSLEATDLGELVKRAAAGTASGTPLTLKLETELPLLQLDRTRIRLLLRNLLDNAQRHRHAANQPIEICLSLSADAVQMTVRDHGPGIPADQLSQLGQAFFRLDAARQRSTGGVGLGLYLCRLVAQAHGGELVLEDAGPGLRACVRLPV